MNLLFLDFDGVINSWLYFESEQYQYNKQNYTKSEKVNFFPSYVFDKRLISNINQLIQQFNFNIVLSTSYRFWLTNQECQQYCDYIWLQGNVIGKTKTFWSWYIRWKEINDYLSNIKDQQSINIVLIIDDENDMTDYQKQYYFYQTLWDQWFDDKCLQQITELLKNWFWKYRWYESTPIINPKTLWSNIDFDNLSDYQKNFLNNWDLQLFKL